MHDLKPDLAISQEAAEEICARLDPRRRSAGVRKIYGGEIAAIHEITFDDDGPAVILKVYPDSLKWKMRKEAAIMARVSGRLRAEVPRVLLSDDTKQALPLSYLVMSKLEGVTLGSLERGLSREAMHAAYVQIGGLLSDFHQIVMDGFGYIGETGIVTRHADNRSYLMHQFERNCADYVARGGGEELARRIAAHAAERQELFVTQGAARLCHNDLHAGNLMAHTELGGVRITGVLDFEGALAGDPRFDIAKAMFYLNAEQKVAVLEGYGAVADQRMLDALALYHLYFTLSLWCWFAQIGQTDRLDALRSDLARAVS